MPLWLAATHLRISAVDVTIFVLSKHPNSFGIVVGCAICGPVPLRLLLVIYGCRRLAHCLFVYETLNKCGCPFFQEFFCLCFRMLFLPFCGCLRLQVARRHLNIYLSPCSVCFFALQSHCVCIIFILYQSSNTHCRLVV